MKEDTMNRIFSNQSDFCRSRQGVEKSYLNDLSLVLEDGEYISKHCMAGHADDSIPP